MNTVNRRTTDDQIKKRTEKFRNRLIRFRVYENPSMPEKLVVKIVFRKNY